MMSIELRLQTDRRAVLVKSLELTLPNTCGVWRELNDRTATEGEAWLRGAMLYDFEVVFVSRYPIAERSKLHLELKLPFQSAAGVVIEIHKFLADIIGTRNATRVAVEFVHRRACEHAPWMQAREMTTWDDRWMLSTGIEHFVEDSDLKAVARVIGASRIIC